MRLWHTCSLTEETNMKCVHEDYWVQTFLTQSLSSLRIASSKLCELIWLWVSAQKELLALSEYKLEGINKTFIPQTYQYGSSISQNIFLLLICWRQAHMKKLITLIKLLFINNMKFIVRFLLMKWMIWVWIESRALIRDIGYLGGPFEICSAQICFQCNFRFATWWGFEL